ncbi:MAG: hypothetical protein JOZ31_02320 [Verrucomicrobia bacterium]|nr:hypothetical protein [Verrucomicrobiota bacterium]MBV8482558.1 hypothetical protein [Verrucomicrobiota bacterium]
MKTFALICCTLGLSAPLVLGGDDFENLKAEAISQFVKQANTADSALAKIIKAYNEETVDGRNPDGAVRLPVTRADLRALVVSGAIETRPFHYAEVENGRCVATGNSATVLIALSSRQSEHLSQDYETLTFTTSVEEHLSFSAKTKEAHDCEEDSDDAKVKTVLQTSEFKQIKLDIGNEEEK